MQFRFRRGVVKVLQLALLLVSVSVHLVLAVLTVLAVNVEPFRLRIVLQVRPGPSVALLVRIRLRMSVPQIPVHLRLSVHPVLLAVQSPGAVQFLLQLQHGVAVVAGRRSSFVLFGDRVRHDQGVRLRLLRSRSAQVEQKQTGRDQRQRAQNGRVVHQFRRDRFQRGELQTSYVQIHTSG